MALVVESTSVSTPANGQATIVVTAPTGIQTGDLLVIIAAESNNVAAITSTGFTRQLNSSITNTENVTTSFLYKVAELADESTGSYTVNFTSTELSIAVAMFRISGWSSSNPIFVSDVGTLSSTGTSNVVETVNLEVVSPQLLIMAGASVSDGSHSSFSNYDITSVDTDPTWTELIDSDSSVRQSSTNDPASMFVAYANRTPESNITEYKFTSVSDSGASTRDHAYFLAVICEPVNANADVSHLAIAPTLESVTATNTATATIDHLAITPTIENVSAKSTSDTTVWTSPTKETTTWTEPDLL